MDVSARLTELAKMRGVRGTPVVSVYLNTRWGDEHQRDRVRVFLKNEIRKARKSAAAGRIEADLDWIQAEGDALIAQSRFPEAHGVALFACRGLGLREVIPVRLPFENAFVVADVPFLLPLAALLEKTPSALVVFVDGESARLVPLTTEGVGEEVALESEVPGHHRRGGWAQLAQSRYQRHIQDHRGRHFEAVVEALIGLTEGNGVRRILMAGEPRTIAVFQKRLPNRIAERVVGSIAGARHESAAVLVGRAAPFLAHLRGGEGVDAVEAVLTEAAKGGRAVAGLEETLEAVARGAVQRLYLLEGFSQPGRLCVECGGLQSGGDAACRLCGKPTRVAELGGAIVGRVIATGGKVETVQIHQVLARVGGVAALLRYPL
jgi:peptide subunit release factor 1 (eRF1)